MSSNPGSPPTSPGYNMEQDTAMENMSLSPANMSTSPTMKKSPSPFGNEQVSPVERIIGPESPEQSNRSRSPSAPRCFSPVESDRSHARSPAQSERSLSASPAGYEGKQAESGSPAGSTRSRSALPAEGNKSRSVSPGASNRSRSGSTAESDRSRSGSPARSGRSRSGSPAGSGRSRSVSPAGSGRSRSLSPAGSGRSRAESPARSSISGSVSPARSGRSRSGSPEGINRSRSGSPAPSSRSRSGSPAGSARSRSGSSVGSNRSRSRSPSGSDRSRSGSPAVSRSRSVSPSGSERSRSESPPGSNRSRSVSPVASGRSESPGGSEPQASSPGPAGRPGSPAADSDAESEEGELIAEIFGSSDEEEEFEGFGKAEVEGKKKKTVVSDDEADDDLATGQEEEGVLPQLSSEDEGVEDIKPSKGGNDDEPADFVSDFDLMLQRRKEEMGKRRKKRKDVDIINDSDDLIADLITRMKTAAEEDRELNKNKKPAVKKLQLLPFVQSQLKKSDLHFAFLDQGILSAMTEWLAPLPDKSLPHLNIRDMFLQVLQQFPSLGPDSLKRSGIGKAVMYLYKHPKEVRANKDKAGKLIHEWSRPIFNLTSNFKALSKEEREQRDYEHLPKKRRLSQEMTPRRDIDQALKGEEKAMRPGDPGWVGRARVPLPSKKDYVVRPKWNVEEMHKGGGGKKKLNRYEKQMRKHLEKKKRHGNERAVTISIEGRNMAL